MSFFDDASLAFLPSGAAGKDGKAYSIKPVPEYGPEEVANGDFATDSDWTKESGWTISGGSANCLNGSGVSIYQTNVLDIGKYYKLTFTVSNYSQGFLGSIGNDFGGVVADTYGSYEIFGTATSTFFGFSAFGNFIGSIDNVSVKEVIKGDGDFTFSRGSNLAATRVGADGLIEKGRENLFLYSNQFDTGWPTSNATFTSGQSGYDGSSDAWLLTSSLAGGRVQLSRSDTGINTTSAYFKKGSADGVWLRVDMGTDANIYVNLIDGTKINSTGEIATKITDVGNGWYRVELTANWVSANNVRIYPSDASGAAVVGSIYIQDAQLEIGLAATDYIESGATTGKAGLLEDEPRFDYSGGATCPSLLLEPSRTNLVKQSEYFEGTGWTLGTGGLTSNTTETTSPEGLYNATKLVDTNNATQLYHSGMSVTASTQYTFSFYAKGDIGTPTLAVYDESNGAFILVDTAYSISEDSWTRIEETITTPVGCTSLRVYPIRGTGSGTIYFYGVQTELGSYPTSYIPNHSGTGSVTRGVDVCGDAGDVNTFNSTEGVLYFEVAGFENDLSSRYISISDGTSNNAIRVFYYQDSGTTFFRKNVNGVQTTIFSTNDINKSELNKIAIKYNSTNFDIFSNGVKLSTNLDSNSFSINTLSEVNFANGDGVNNPFNGKVNQLLTFNTALSDADCITLTTL